MSFGCDLNLKESRSKSWIGMPPLPDTVNVAGAGGAGAAGPRADGVDLPDWVANAAAHPEEYASPGREDLVETAVEALLGGQSVLLVGNAGSGKTQLGRAIAGSLARLNGMNDFSYSVYEMDKNTFIGGQCYVGDVPKRVNAIIKFVEDNHPAIVFIDEIHSLIGAGANQHENADVFQQLKPKIASGDFAVVGATTPAEIGPFAQDRALVDRFVRIDVPDIDDAMIRQILEQNPAVLRLQRRHENNTVTAGAFDAAVEISSRGRFAHMSRMRGAVAVLVAAFGKAGRASAEAGNGIVVAELTEDMVRAVEA